MKDGIWTLHQNNGQVRRIYRIAGDQRSLKARDMLSVIGLLKYSKKVRSDVWISTSVRHAGNGMEIVHPCNLGIGYSDADDIDVLD